MLAKGGLSMGLCEGRVAIVTGGGRGLGRAYCLMLAAHGAKVLVNDMGAEADGNGADTLPAHQVVDEIRRAGGEAEANFGDVSDWADAQAMIEQAHKARSEEHTSELQSLMRISYAVFCLKINTTTYYNNHIPSAVHDVYYNN